MRRAAAVGVRNLGLWERIVLSVEATAFFSEVRVHRFVTPAAVLLLGGALACGGGSTGPSTGSGTTTGNPATPGSGGSSSGTTITVIANGYSPDNMTVPVGSTVTWKWDSCTSDGYGGQTCIDHNVTFSDGSASPTQSAGTFARGFAAAGTYPYHCSIHGTYMSGTIVVR